MTGNLKTLWGEMPVHHQSRGLALTDLIDSDCTLDLDGTIYTFSLRIDPTYVRGSLRHWMVDACRCYTLEDSPIKSEFFIPEEACLVSFNFGDWLHMKVSEVTGPGYVTLPDGSVHHGTLTLPKTISRWQGIGSGLWIVDEVVALGNVG